MSVFSFLLQTPSSSILAVASLLPINRKIAFRVAENFDDRFTIRC